MNPPLTTLKRSDESPLDSDAELTWPPEDSRFVADVLDLETRRVMSIQEVAIELDGAAPASGPGPTPGSIAATPFARDEVAVPPPRAARVAGDALLESPRRVTERRPSTPFAMRALMLIVIVQAAIVGVLIQGRSQAQPETPTNRGPAVPGAAAAPLPPSSPVPANTTAAPVSEPAQPTHGRLVVRSDPPGAVVVIDGRRRGTAPLSVDALAAGSHRVQVSTAGASVEHVVTIDAGSTTSLIVPMTGTAADAGWVNVAAPIPVQILENGRLLGSSADGPYRLPIGTHHLELLNDALAFRSRETVAVRGGEISRVNPTIPDGVLHVNAQPWAHIWVDGEAVGDTPLANIKVRLGQHEIRFRHPSLGEQVRQVVVSAREPVRVSVNMKP
jgi:PEGA domain